MRSANLVVGCVLDDVENKKKKNSVILANCAD